MTYLTLVHERKSLLVGTVSYFRSGDSSSVECNEGVLLLEGMPLAVGSHVLDLRLELAGFLRFINTRLGPHLPM